MKDFEVSWTLNDTKAQSDIDNNALAVVYSSLVSKLSVDHRLASQPLKKYNKMHSYIPFKKRLIGTLNRMEIEGGHSPEVLETIANLIKEDE